MRTKFVAICVVTSFLLSSCAMIFPVHHPDITRDEFTGLVSAGSDRTVCYEKGFRGGMMFLDFVLGAPFLFIPLIVDAGAGKYTAYYYHASNCERVKSEERGARLTSTIAKSQPPVVIISNEQPPAEPIPQQQQQAIPEKVPSHIESDDEFEDIMPTTP